MNDKRFPAVDKRVYLNVPMPSDLLTSDTEFVNRYFYILDIIGDEALRKLDDLNIGVFSLEVTEHLESIARRNVAKLNKQ